MSVILQFQDMLQSLVLHQVKGTPVVCPMVIVIQWRNEIARFIAEGSIKVLVIMAQIDVLNDTCTCGKDHPVSNHAESRSELNMENNGQERS